MTKTFNYRGIMALENIEEEAIDVSEMGAGMLEMAENSTDTAELSDQIDEAEDSLTTLGQFGEQLAIEKKCGISEQTADTMRVAVEHLSKRLGFPSTHRIMPAMERFGTAEQRITSTELAMQNIAKTTALVTQRLAVAQEGFLDNVKYGFKLIFTNEKKLVKRMREVSEKYDAQGAREDDMKAPPFSKVFNPNGETRVASKDVVGVIASFSKLIGSDQLVKSVRKATSAVDKIAGVVKRTNFVADDLELDEIQKILGEMEAIQGEVRAVLKGGTRDMSSTAAYEPLTAQDKAKLVGQVTDLLRSDSLESEVNRFSKALEEALNNPLLNAASSVHTLISVAVNVATSLRKDKQLAKQGLDRAVAVFEDISSIVEMNLSVCHAAITYIEFSTKK
jgi:hypothetical protein